jgi:uncharacterized DUF497 family protein
VKAKRNLLKHKIAFEVAQKVFFDPHVVSYEDCDADGEIRFHAVGYATDRLLAIVIYVDHSEGADEVLHIISARKAEEFEESLYADQFA